MTRFRLTKDARFYKHTIPAGTECVEATEAEYEKFFAAWPPGLVENIVFRDSNLRLVHLDGKLRVMLVEELEVVL